MKTVKRDDMREIALKMYPNLPFDKAMALLRDQYLVVPLRMGHGKKHYNIMDKLITYLD